MSGRLYVVRILTEHTSSTAYLLIIVSSSISFSLKLHRNQLVKLRFPVIMATIAQNCPILDRDSCDYRHYRSKRLIVLLVRITFTKFLQQVQFQIFSKNCSLIPQFLLTSLCNIISLVLTIGLVPVFLQRLNLGYQQHQFQFYKSFSHLVWMILGIQRDRIPTSCGF